LSKSKTIGHDGQLRVKSSPSRTVDLTCIGTRTEFDCVPRGIFSGTWSTVSERFYSTGAVQVHIGIGPTTVLLSRLVILNTVDS